MRWFHHCVAAALAVALLAGCGGRGGVATLEDIDECSFPDDGVTDAPTWVCDAPVEGLTLHAVGSHPETAAGINFQKQHAMATARLELAQVFRIKVGGLIKQYTETTGQADSETVDSVFATVGRQITNETLVGTRVYRSRRNPNTGTLFVLVGLTSEAENEVLREAVSRAARSSQGDARAAWQRLQAGKSHEELAEEMAKLND